MAKLTEQEQAAVTALTKLLAKGLPTPQRSSAGGIASGLVRMRKEQLSADDVRAVLTRYDAQAVPLQNLVDARALIAVGEGLFSLGTASGEVPNSPAPEQDPAGAPAATPSKRGGAPAASAAQGEPSSGSAKPARKQIAKQPARGLARLSCVRKQTPELNDIRRQITTRACGSTAGCSAPPRPTRATSASCARSATRSRDPPRSETAP